MCHKLQLCILVSVAALVSTAAEIAAQDPTRVIVGAVIDSSSRHPLSDVDVYVDGNHRIGRSDTTGEFGLRDLPTGSHTLHLIKAGYLPQTYRFTIPQEITGEIDVGIVLLSHGPAPSAGVSGSVINAVSGQPVIAGSVTLNGEKSTFTGGDGAFHFSEPELRWGRNWVGFRGIGYEPLVASLWVLNDDANIDLDVELAPRAVRLAEVVVEGERTTLVYGRMRDFYRRKRIGFGEFFTPADIERIRPIYVSSLLRRIPGVWVYPAPDGSRHVRMFGGRRDCHPLIYWNGIRSSWLDIDMFWPEDLKGVEVYRRPSEIPIEFNTTGSACGVVAVWTR
jgi:hypothetical protein